MEDQVEQAIDIYTNTSVLDIPDIKRQIYLIHCLMKDVMKEGTHYGTIPGTLKPTLYKAGAEKINFLFRLSATYPISECIIKDLPDGHREVTATCILTHIPTGKVWGSAIGSCSTMEGKYRFRNDVEWTGKTVPKEYWTNRDVALLGGRDFVAKKNDDGKWEIAKKSGKVEHDNPADYFNVVLKMAQKRAMTSADVGSTACSDIFTVDLEGMPEVIPGAKGKAEPLNPVIQPEEIEPAQVGDDPPDTTEQEWLEEEHKMEGRISDDGEGAQEDIAFKDRPFPGDTDKGKKIDKGKAKILYAKWKNVPGWGDDERRDFLADIEFSSIYDITESKYDDVRKTLDSFYGK